MVLFDVIIKSALLWWIGPVPRTLPHPGPVSRNSSPISSGEGNGKPLQYSWLENPTNSMKRQKYKTLKDELPRLVGAQYATEEEWRNNSRKKRWGVGIWKSLLKDTSAFLNTFFSTIYEVTQLSKANSYLCFDSHPPPVVVICKLSLSTMPTLPPRLYRSAFMILYITLKIVF